MRYLAEVKGKQRAEAFVAYLVTLSIPTHIEASSQSEELWEIWIRDEDTLNKARAEFQQFAANPDDPKYAAAIVEARQIIKQKQEAAQAAAKNIKPVSYRGPSGSLSSGRIPPLTLTLLITCIAVSLMSNFMSPRPNARFGNQVIDKLSFVSPRAYKTS
ncbi:MAG: hypothetical protein IT423_23465, partial [Pirellulaceae bacterium]|nr:hypothetical protein [Pirellulaceae bacterium]